MTGQRKGTAIAMAEDERDAFLRTQPACRVATVGPTGRPHASTLWFATALRGQVHGRRRLPVRRLARLTPARRGEDRAGTSPSSAAEALTRRSNP